MKTRVYATPAVEGLMLGQRRGHRVHTLFRHKVTLVNIIAHIHGVIL